MRILYLLLAAILADVLPMGAPFVRPLQQRDSILIADQIRYGFSLDDPGEGLLIPDLSWLDNDTLVLVSDWQIDTLRSGGIEAGVVLSPFEEGIYHLPPLYLVRYKGDVADTLVFDSVQIDVRSLPVDTATFSVHPLKGQINYPVTFAEIVPYIGGFLLLAALVAVLIIFLPKLFRKKTEQKAKAKDPAHIVALRELEHYRSDKFWAPEQQKIFYSGITDILKTYMDERFGIDAPEMTTAELFAALKDCKDVPQDLYVPLKEMFERADFVKFAKYVADKQDNAAALPLAVKFVSSTYQTQLEEEAKKDVL